MREFRLDNGLQVLCEPMPHLRSASVGVWVRAGSILESTEENGLSHFLEHMAFKGTKRRTARQIAEEMDAVGGHLNASTSKLCTNYYAKVIDEDLPLAVDLLSDIVCNPLLDDKDVDKERGVILEEISMVDDTPDDVVFDVMAEASFGDQPLGRTILGPAERIASYTSSDLRAYREKHYSPGNAVVALAGNIDIDQVQSLIQEHFGAWSGSGGEEYPVCQINQPPRTLLRKKDVEQVQLCVNYVGNPTGSPLIYATATLSNILGGGMSSRLFQRVREELGMAYTIYSSPSSYPHCGEFTIYAAASPKNADRVLLEIDSEIDKLLRDGIDEKEFKMAKAQLKGGFILGLESAYNRMSALGHNKTLLGRNIPPEETIAGIESVTIEDCMAVAKRILRSERSIARVCR